MKVSILGAGNAGCFTAVHYAFFTQQHDVEIELIHNLICFCDLLVDLKN